MSVTMHLFRILPDTDYLGHYTDNFTAKDYIEDDNGFCPYEYKEKSLGAPMDSYGHVPYYDSKEYPDYKKWEKEQNCKAWSDGKEHYKLDFSYIKQLFGNDKSWRRTSKKLKTIPFKNYNGCKYLTTDIIAYAQGWFFKNRFFKKKATVVICTTKQEMINFFNQYVVLKDKYAQEVFQEFITNWEDGMIFKCAF